MPANHLILMSNHTGHNYTVKIRAFFLLIFTCVNMFSSIHTLDFRKKKGLNSALSQINFEIVVRSITLMIYFHPCVVGDQKVK